MDSNQDTRHQRGSRPDGTGDLELLLRVAVQEVPAFRCLYDRYYRPVYRFLYRFGRRPDLVEEAVNDVMLVVWNKAATFQNRSKVSTWIMGIAYRKGLKISEKIRRDADRLVELDAPSIAEASHRSRGHAEEALTRDWLESGLKELSPEHRAVVELTYFHGYSYREIAEVVDCPVNTVKSRMFHARLRLKSLLSGTAEIARSVNHAAQ